MLKWEHMLTRRTNKKKCLENIIGDINDTIIEINIKDTAKVWISDGRRLGALRKKIIKKI